MTTTNSAKRAGARFESDVVAYLREAGFTADRLAKAGAKDEGDVYFEAEDLAVLAELKARRSKTNSLSLASWLAEAELEAKHYAAARNIPEPVPVLIVKRPNKSIGDAFVILTLEQFIGSEHD